MSDTHRPTMTGTNGNAATRRRITAPRPSDAAEPNSVAKIAQLSMIRPPGPSARLPSSGRKAALISCGRPGRYEPYAMASPTTA